MGIEIVGGPANTKAKVNLSQRLTVAATTRSTRKQAVLLADSYNLVSGSITLTSANESGIIYVKNNENRDLLIETASVDLGPSTDGTGGAPLIKIIRNPTTGTMISTATTVDINSNLNFASSKTLTVDAYKGAEAETVTDGSDHELHFTKSDTEVLIQLDILLEKGDSMAITVTPELNNSSTLVLSDLRVHLVTADDV